MSNETFAVQKGRRKNLVDLETGERVVGDAGRSAKRIQTNSNNLSPLQTGNAWKEDVDYVLNPTPVSRWMARFTHI